MKLYKTKLIDVSLFNSSVLVTYGMKGEDVLHLLDTKYLLDILPDETREKMKAFVPEPSRAMTFNLMKYHGGVVVLLDVNPTIDVIPHEAVHAAQDILENGGTFFNDETEEVFAYMIGMLSKEMMLGKLVKRKK